MNCWVHDVVVRGVPFLSSVEALVRFSRPVRVGRFEAHFQKRQVKQVLKPDPSLKKWR